MFEALFRTTMSDENYPSPLMTAETKQVSTTSIPPQKNNKGNDLFSKDIIALESRFGELEKGSTLEITLQELLSIAPRQRARTDAYDKLRAYLRSEYSVTLIIKSRKHGHKN